MKYTDFRIGNYVSFIFRNKKEIQQIDSTDLMAMSENPTIKLPLGLIIEPIKLNEEWLLSLGFTKSLDYWFIPNKGFFFGITLNDYVYPMFDEENRIPIKLNYVHQLQNLFNIFTDSELIIKNK